MSIFDVVTFDPKDIKAVRDGTADRRTIMAVLTSQTCGEPCWYAKEEVCRCSCGGKNHGCLINGGERPERTSKIAGHLYKLAGVGPYLSLISEANRINKQQYSYIEKPRFIIGGFSATHEEWIKAKSEGKECWVSQYYGTWSETDPGAPARIKNPSENQKKWKEFEAFKEDRGASMLWVRIQMPEAPTQIKVDNEGNPTSQIPK